MAGLSLGISWAKTPDIVLTFNDVEIARIKFVSTGRKRINIEAKPYIKITREKSKCS